MEVAVASSAFPKPPLAGERSPVAPATRVGAVAAEPPKSDEAGYRPTPRLGEASAPPPRDGLRAGPGEMDVGFVSEAEGDGGGVDVEGGEGGWARGGDGVASDAGPVERRTSSLAIQNVQAAVPPFMISGSACTAVPRTPQMTTPRDKVFMLGIANLLFDGVGRVIMAPAHGGRSPAQRRIGPPSMVCLRRWTRGTQPPYRGVDGLAGRRADRRRAPRAREGRLRSRTT